MQKVQSLELVQTPHSARPLALVIVLLLLSIVLGLILIPWQQSVSGSGRVIIFSPMERPQNVEAQIPARILKWHVREGVRVKRGDLIVELAELDPKYLDPEQLQRLEGQKRALQMRLEAAHARAEALQQQIAALEQSRNNALPAADRRVRQAEDRLYQAEQALEAARQARLTAELNLNRVRELESKGLRSRRDRELAELEYTRTATEVERAQAALELARKDTEIARLDRAKLDADTTASISSVLFPCFDTRDYSCDYQRSF